MNHRQPPPAVLECRGLMVAYTQNPVLSDLNLRVEPDRVIAVLGPSGSGKSTLLGAVAGFLQPRAGEIHIDGRLVATAGRGDPPEARNVGFVFQNYALWPHLAAVDTVAYPIRRRGVRSREARRRALDLLERMGIAHLAHRRPADLSGGQQQRVGVARAIAREAALYLFDEPTAHLDTALRGALQEELAERRKATGAAAVYATHDAGEALAVADGIALLHGGRLAQAGTPREIYEQPVDLWAARLTGPASVLDARMVDMEDGKAVCVIAGQTLRLEYGGPIVRSGQSIRALVRPEWTCLGGPLGGVVGQVWYRGSHTDYRLETSAGAVDVRQTGPPTARAGERVQWNVHRVWHAAPGSAASPRG